MELSDVLSENNPMISSPEFPYFQYIKVDEESGDIVTDTKPPDFKPIKVMIAGVSLKIEPAHAISEFKENTTLGLPVNSAMYSHYNDLVEDSNIEVDRNKIKRNEFHDKWMRKGLSRFFIGDEYLNPEVTSLIPLGEGSDPLVQEKLEKEIAQYSDFARKTGIIPRIGITYRAGEGKQLYLIVEMKHTVISSNVFPEVEKINSEAEKLKLRRKKEKMPRELEFVDKNMKDWYNGDSAKVERVLKIAYFVLKRPIYSTDEITDGDWLEIHEEQADINVITWLISTSKNLAEYLFTNPSFSSYTELYKDVQDLVENHIDDEGKKIDFNGFLTALFERRLSEEDIILQPLMRKKMKIILNYCLAN